MRDLCMVPSHNCYIYGIWRGKEVRRGGVLKSPLGWRGSHKRRTDFYEGF